MTSALGIDVSEELMAMWRGWFAPGVQPFDTSSLTAHERDLLPGAPADSIQPELRDTFMVYSRGWQMLDREQFEGLPRSVRRDLTGRRPRGWRTVWWPNDLAAAGDGPVLRYVAWDAAPSRHAEVPDAVWKSCEHALPDARRLAGTFPLGSGPNCFGTVMAAAGVPGSEHEWMLQHPFEAWLSRSAHPVQGTRDDDGPGVVLVWRDENGLAQHAAVTVGGGWCFSKPSQAWCSPRLGWPTSTTVRRCSRRGLKLERHVLRAGHAS